MPPTLKPMEPEAKRTLLRRLKRIEGQVRGLQRMVADEVYCVDILHQVTAVRAALHEVGRALLGGHVERCVVGAVRSGNRRARDRKLAELLDVLGRLNGA
ncbi:MAG TPA: metal-sensitive transcriptional regulator [Methylomirabilota bacterium]|jgi:DNA-binding FrmR family transcriptional regulator|nr:metal-sensitive transcriptional regulator [Methylomirabilota bacterium]